MRVISIPGKDDKTNCYTAVGPKTVYVRVKARLQENDGDIRFEREEVNR